MSQKFGVGYLIGVSRTDNQGNLLAIPQPYRFGILQDVSSEFSFEGKPLYGANSLPVDRGRGKAKLSFSAKMADISIEGLSALHFGVTPAVGFKGAAVDIPVTIAATTTPSIPSSGTFVADMGVSDTSGNRYKRVSSAPAVGQYSVSAGVYTFNASDVGKAALISLEYSAATGSTMSLSNTLMGYSPSFQVMLFNDSKATKMAVKLTNCQSDKLSLPFKNEDFTVADFSWEALDDGTGTAGYVSIM